MIFLLLIKLKSGFKYLQIIQIKVNIHIMYEQQCIRACFGGADPPKNVRKYVQGDLLNKSNKAKDIQ